MNYRADIDGLRALAVLSVMLHHLSGRWLPGGFVGVDVFFVISGFVVCASLAGSGSDSVGGFIGGFYARRLARIVPALVGMLTVTSVLATLFIPRAYLSDLSDQTARSAYFGLSNWVLSNSETYFAPRSEFNPFSHTWSLGVEEQFYLAFPLVCFLWVRSHARQRTRLASRLVILLGSVGLASFAGSWWATAEQPADAFYLLWFRFWELTAGAVLFQATVHNPAWPRSRPVGMLGPWIGLTAVAAALIFADPLRFPFPWAIPAVAGSVLLIGGASATRTHPVRRFFAHRQAVWLGKRSYSLYLWHWPVFVLFRWTVGLERWDWQVAAIALTFLAAAFSYRWVETPWRHSRTLQRLPALARTAVFLLVVAVGWKITDGIVWRHDSIGLSVVSRNATDWYADRLPFPGAPQRRCRVEREFESRWGGQVHTFRPGRCAAKPADVRLRLTVFGDSHATAYLPLYEQLSGESGALVTLYAAAGCPYIPLIRPMDQGPALGLARCLGFWQSASAAVLATALPGDLLFLSSLRQPRFVDQWAIVEDVDQLDSPDARALITRATNEASTLLRPFIQRGMTIVVEAPKPLFQSPPFRCSDWFNAANPICRRGFEQSRSHLEARRSPIVGAIRDLAAAEPAVRAWDPFPILCPTAACTPFRNGRPVFFDGDHVSAFGNSLVYPSFKFAVLASWKPVAENSTTTELNLSH